MEIIKKGKLDKEYLYFMCHNEECGTEFKVRRDDSAVEFNNDENKYFCTCPDCERLVVGMNRKDYLMKKNTSQILKSWEVLNHEQKNL